MTLNGWVLMAARKYGNQIFVDLRDRYGLTQVVFESDNADLYTQAGELEERMGAVRDGCCAETARGGRTHRHSHGRGRTGSEEADFRVLNRVPAVAALK